MKVRIGTRGSELAMWQAHHVKDAMQRLHAGLEVQIVAITTTGDKVADADLTKFDGKGVFTKEIEQALLSGEVDLAVHSLKDLPTELPPGLVIGAVLQREDPAEALVSRDNLSLDELPRWARVLTGSLRRQAQLLHRRPDLRIEPVRGNVPTRLRKYQEQGADAIVLARAGLLRLGLRDKISHRLEPAEFLPACGQGALAVEIRADDKPLTDLTAMLNHEPTRICVSAERSFLTAMGGGCQAPVGAYARVESSRLAMTAMACDLQGVRLISHNDSCDASPAGAVALGRSMAEHIRSHGADDIMEEISRQPKLSRENP